MLPQAGQGGQVDGLGADRVHQDKEYDNSARLTCRRPYRGTDFKTGAPRMFACGRATCSRQCRDKWAKKHAACAALEFRTRPPTHHLRLTPTSSLSASDFTTAISRTLEKLKRRLLASWRQAEGNKQAPAKAPEFNYIRVLEWHRGKIHSHVWIRTEFALETEQVKAALASRVPCKFGHSLSERRKSGLAAAKYMFKDLKHKHRKAELPPSDFSGKLFVASRGFFSEPIEKLWKRVKDEWKQLVEERTRQASARAQAVIDSQGIGERPNSAVP